MYYYVSKIFLDMSFKHSKKSLLLIFLMVKEKIKKKIVAKLYKLFLKNEEQKLLIE